MNLPNFSLTILGGCLFSSLILLEFKECQMNSNEFPFQVIADSQREYNGPDSGSSNGGRGSSLSESSTHTVLVIYKVTKVIT